MNKTKGAFDSPNLWSPGCTQSSTSLTSLAPPFAFGQQAMDTALNIILIVVLLVIMVSLGCTIEIAKITTHLRRPKGVAIAVLVQYSIMPLTAFILGKLFQLGTSESLAILICGCCPGGNLSNIFSLALRGDRNLSDVGEISVKLGKSKVKTSTKIICPDAAKIMSASVDTFSAEEMKSEIAETVENQENNIWILQQLLSQPSKPPKLYLLQPAHRSPAVLSNLPIHSLQQPQSHLHPHLLPQRPHSRLSLALSAQKGGDLQKLQSHCDNPLGQLKNMPSDCHTFTCKKIIAYISSLS